MKTKTLVQNAILAALYAALALLFPATALANYRLSTSLYVLAAFNPSLIAGLSLGNALAGLPQGPIDVLMGAIVGLVTATVCAWTKDRFYGIPAALAVLVIPTLLVPLWLALIFHAPYAVIALVVFKGQSLSAVLSLFLVNTRRIRSIVTK